MKPTPEQAHCVDCFGTERKLRINAYAGTGKTSTLKMLAKSTRRRGVYLAFNASIAKEAAREFPRNVRCSTVHSMAFRAMVQKYSPEKMTKKLSSGFVSYKMNLKAEAIDIGKGVEKAPMSSRGWGFLVNDTVTRWLRSGDPEIARHHAVPGDTFAMIPGPLRNALADKIVTRANALWARMIDPKSDLPLTHDGYLKLWALGEPEIAADFILLDEAQDTNGVVLSLMRHQPSQVIAVGDRHQCIYEWRGARNAMVELPVDLEARLSTSFRFGPAIAENASAVLRLLGETVPLKGNPERASIVGDVDNPRAVLCRTNATLIAELAKAIDAERRPYVIGGVNEVLMYVDAAEKLMNGQPVESPLDFFGFKHWSEVKETAGSKDGAELQRWVKLFDEYSTDGLRGMLQSLPACEEDSDVVYSTGHKSKGREWSDVRLTDDFLKGISEDKTGTPKRAEDHAAEMRLYYVAVTRGRDAVEIPSTLVSKLRLLETAPVTVEEPATVTPAVVTTGPKKAAPPCEDFEPIDVDPTPLPAPRSECSEAHERSECDEFEPIDPALFEKPEAAPKKRGRKPVTDSPAKVYPSRLIRCACATCGYTVRTTRKWLKRGGAPVCPIDKVPLAIG